jgi:hypothetical protein
VFHHHGAWHLWFATTSGLTRPAVDLASRGGVVLIDRQALQLGGGRSTDHQQ